MKYRVGRKQGRAILDDKGYEVGLFNKGQEDLAKKVCELLNQGQTLPIDGVSQRSELLKKWWKYFDEESVAVNCNEQEREEVINDFFNCG